MILDYVYLRDVGATYRMVQVTQLEFMKQDGRRFRRKLSQKEFVKGKSFNGERVVSSVNQC